MRNGIYAGSQTYLERISPPLAGLEERSLSWMFEIAYPQKFVLEYLKPLVFTLAILFTLDVHIAT